jgi:hypothetical protein
VISAKSTSESTSLRGFATKVRNQPRSATRPGLRSTSERTLANWTSKANVRSTPIRVTHALSSTL